MSITRQDRSDCLRVIERWQGALERDEIKFKGGFLRTLNGGLVTSDFPYQTIDAKTANLLNSIIEFCKNDKYFYGYPMKLHGVEVVHNSTTDQTVLRITYRPGDTDAVSYTEGLFNRAKIVLDMLSVAERIRLEKGALEINHNIIPGGPTPTGRGPDIPARHNFDVTIHSDGNLISHVGCEEVVSRMLRNAIANEQYAEQEWVQGKRWNVGTLKQAHGKDVGIHFYQAKGEQVDPTYVELFVREQIAAFEKKLANGY